MLSPEPLVEAVRANVRIEGTHVPDTTHPVKVSAFADDTTCFVSNDENLQLSMRSYNYMNWQQEQDLMV